MYKTIKPGLVVTPCTSLYISNHDEGIHLKKEDSIIILEVREILYKVLFEGKIYFVYKYNLIDLLEDIGFYNDSR